MDDKNYYKEGSHLIRRVVKLPSSGSTNYLYTIIGKDFEKLYRWLPDKTWETIIPFGVSEGNTFLQEGSNVTVTGTGTEADPYIINSLDNQTAIEVPITAISGLSADNVQSALEEIKTLAEEATGDGSETKVIGSGDISVTGAGTIGDPYEVSYSATVPTLRFTKVELSAEEVRNLGTTPKVAVAAPGAGKAIEVFTAASRLIFNSVAFDGGGDFDVASQSSGVSESQYRSDPSFLGATGDRFFVLQRKTSNAGSQIIENDPLVIRSVDSTVGDSTVVAYITYRIIEL